MELREVDSATLHALRRQAREQLGVAVAALVLAVGATLVLPSLAIPLLLGGIGVGVLGLRTAWRRWDLLDRLHSEP